MRLALLCLLLGVATAPAMTVTYHIEFGLPGLPVPFAAAFVADSLPPAVLRLDYTGDFPTGGSHQMFLDDPRITAVDPMDYAGSPLRLGSSYMRFSNTGLQMIAFDFGPPQSSSDGIVLTAIVPDANGPGSWTSSLVVARLSGSSEPSGCEGCLDVWVTPLLEEATTPEPGSALLIVVPLALAALRRRC